MAQNKYDIFISYRRQGGAQYARILQLMLIQRGYKVFLDYDELTDGIFSDHIKAAIKDAPVFMIVLSDHSMDRCVNEDDWVRQEILMASRLGKHIVPVNPDNKFDGFPEGVPEEIKTAAGSHQHSEISFGQALGVTTDLMIKNRLVDKLGARTALGHKDEDYDAARETLARIDKRNRFMKRMTIAGVIAALLIVLGTCWLFWKKGLQKDTIEQQRIELQDLRAELEKKYSDYLLVLDTALTRIQMETIDDILSKMVPVGDQFYMSQFEFTQGQWHGLDGDTIDPVMRDVPITGISMGNIRMKLIWLHDMTNVSFTLPSPDQWEYAARGGENKETTTYVGSNDPDSVAWYEHNSGNALHPSNGQQELFPNFLDLFDMSGNASELCNISGGDIYCCGGNYTSPASEVTATSRKVVDPNNLDQTVGFRVIIEMNTTN
ncbi:MAG: SUMF1/EgtB/PvdO family nonheme iron enzyme [Muribaculaceae bacterium]|nr:SUMF1/EgtB/PvdO family nonheme iron enzyme [Muribaculaceae bacterium]